MDRGLALGLVDQLASGARGFGRPFLGQDGWKGGNAPA